MHCLWSALTYKNTHGLYLWCEMDRFLHCKYGQWPGHRSPPTFLLHIRYTAHRINMRPSLRSSCISVFISSRTKGKVSRWPLHLLWRAEEYFGGPKNRYLTVFLLHHNIVNVVRNTANPLVSWTVDDRCPNTRKKWYTFILDIKKGPNVAVQ